MVTKVKYTHISNINSFVKLITNTIPILLFLTGITYRFGFDSGFLSKILLTKAVKLDNKRYASEMYHELVTPVTEHKTELPEIDAGEVGKEVNSVLIHPGVSKMSVSKNKVKVTCRKSIIIIQYFLFY